MFRPIPPSGPESGADHCGHGLEPHGPRALFRQLCRGLPAWLALLAGVVFGAEPAPTPATPASSDPAEHALAQLPAERFVLGSVVQLREGPGPEARVSNRLRIGTRVQVLEVRGALARVRSDGGDEGWAPLELFSPAMPTVSWCIEQALKAPTPFAALKWRHRAHALEPWNRALLEGLEAAYRAAGDPEKAAGVAARLEPTGPLLIASCDPGRCRIWLELEHGRFFRLGDGPQNRSVAGLRTRLKAMDGWFVLLDGQPQGWYAPSTTVENQAIARGVFEDSDLGEGVLSSRLTRPLELSRLLPGTPALKQRVSDWALALNPRPDWVWWSRTGPTPVAVRAFAAGEDSRGVAVVIEARFDLESLEPGASGPRTATLLGWLTPDGRLEVEGMEGFPATEAASHGGPASARVRGVVDLDGDGRGEALIAGAIDGASGAPAIERLWRLEPGERGLEWRRILAEER